MAQLTTPKEGVAALPARGDPLTKPQLIALQRGAGNRAVLSLRSNAPVQRKDDPNADVKKRLDVLEKKETAHSVDAEWQPKILAHVADRKQAVYKISTAFQTALTNFQAAHTKQAQADAIKTQWAALAISMVVATVYEPVFDRAFGKWGKEVERLRDQIENPLNTLVQGGVGSVLPAHQAHVTAERGQPQPMAGADLPKGDPVTFLTGQLDTMEGHTKAIQMAFSARAGKYKDPQFDWDSFNADNERKQYATDLRKAETVFGPAGGLKPGDELALVIERHLWASWVRWMATNFQWTGGSFGAQINGALNRAGVPGAAGTSRLDDTYFLWPSNPRSDFRQVGKWSGGYDEKLAGK